MGFKIIQHKNTIKDQWSNHQREGKKGNPKKGTTHRNQEKGRELVPHLASQQLSASS